MCGLSPEDLRQPLQGCTQSLLAESRVVDDQAFLRPAGDLTRIIVPQAADPDARVGAEPQQRRIRQVGVDAQEEVEARVLLQDGDVLTKGLFSSSSMTRFRRVR